MALYDDKKTTSKSITDASRKRRYELDICRYPQELDTTEIKHYLEIQINVRGKSKYDKNKRLFKIDRPVDAATLSDDELSQSAIFSTTADSAVFGNRIAGKIAKVISKTGSKTAEFLGTVVGGALGYNTIKTNELLKPDTKHRISDAINLYIAEPPAVKYSTNWANKDLGSLAGIISGSAFRNGLSAGSGEAFGALAMNTAKLPSLFGAIDVKDIVSASSGTSLNPFKECIFESVNHRSFAMTYRFMPRNASESLEVQKIIRLLKFHMHPELSEGKLFFIYPSEFQLTYYFNGKENESLFKFAPCILSDLEISYGEGQFSSFDDGYPVETIVKMTFRETEINTKESIEKGR